MSTDEIKIDPTRDHLQDTAGDPFILRGKYEPLQRGATHFIDFKKIPPPRMAQLVRMGKRASAAIVDVAKRNPQRHITPPAPQIAALMFAVCDHWRGLDLDKFEAANDLTFMAEFVKIASRIDARNNFFPADCPLTFATR